MHCPNCNFEIENEQINIQTDLGRCSNCNFIFKISEHFDATINDSFDISKPIQGTWYRKEMNHIVIGASTRSPLAFVLVPFMLVWTSGALGGIYGTQIINGEFNLLISLFGIPFIIGAVIFWRLAIMSIWGRVELKLDRMGGQIFTGVGKIGKTQKFDWADISTIKEIQFNYSRRGNITSEIVLEGLKQIKFAKGVNESRRYYMLQALKSIFAKVKTKQRFI